VADLEEAIGLYEKTLRLRSAGHMRRAESLNDLGNAFFLFCFHHESDKTRSNRCIELHREALRLRTPGHPLRDQSLHNLARSLRTIIHHQLGGLEILMECASLNREALQLRPSGHPERWRCMDDLATDLTRIVEHTGDIDMQAEIVSMRRAVLRMSSPGHPSRETSLNHLASAIVISFEHRGGSDDLAEAISVSREALNLRPIGHPRRFSSLVNLANTLALRAIYEGPSQLLTEAIGLYREAASLLSGSHPARAIIMLNLSESLLTSFRIRGDGSALVEAIGLLRELVTLPSYAHDDTLSNLAEALEAKYDEGTSTKALSNTANLGRGDLHLQPIGPRGDLNVLSEALKLHRDALQLRPVGHVRWFLSLEGLARVLCRIRCESWPEALSSYQEALDACPVGYPARVRLLSGMSKCFLDPSSPSFSLSEGISCLSEAYAHPFTHVSGRLKSAGPDLQHLEAAYDHDASTRATQTSSHSRDETKVLDLYAQVIDLLPLAANFGLDHSARLQALTSSEGIARNAAARAMLLDCLPQAVEMLEQGRGVFWTQTLHLRANAFDEVPEDDRKELQRMLRVLEHGARRVESMDQSPAQQERELQTRRQLNEAVQALISKIRDYPDLDRFLLPPAFDALFGSLPDGFVVILNASKLGHHALLLNRSTALATSLALKPFQIGFDFAKLRAQLPRDMMSATERGSDGETRAMRIDSGRTRSFEDVLSLLWTSVVKPVLDALGLNVGVTSNAAYVVSDSVSTEIARARTTTTLVVRDG
jgi:tetratricopeptide (TPR) repeat protein